MKTACLALLIFAAGCSSSAFSPIKTNGISKQEFYKKALALAEESQAATAHQKGQWWNAAKSVYTMTIGDIKKRLGNPESILKMNIGDSPTQVWAYHCTDGLVNVTIEDYNDQNYRNQTSMDHDNGTGVIQPSGVNMI